MSGWLSIINASDDDFNKLAAAIDNSEGSTKKMAETMSSNAKGSILEMKSALEESGIKVFKAVAPAVTKVAKSIGELANKFSNLSPEAQENIIKLGLFAIATGPVIKGIGTLSNTIGGALSIAGRFSKALKAVETTTAAVTTVTEVAGTVTAGTTAALEGATVATGALGATAGSLVLPVAAVVASLAAVGYAGYKIYQTMSEDVTPAVDLFEDKVTVTSQNVNAQYGAMANSVKTETVKISESTKEAVSGYLELDKKASDALMDLRINSDTFTQEAKNKVLDNFNEMSQKSTDLSEAQRIGITKEFKKLVADTGTLTTKNKDEIIKKYSDMVNGTTELTKEQKEQTIKEFKDTLEKSVAITQKQSEELQKTYKDMSQKIKDGLDKKYDEEVKSLKTFYEKTNVLTAQEQNDILKKSEEHWSKKKKGIEEYQAKIDSIIQNAANEHRQISEEESKTIADIQHDMKENAIKTLSENEVESKVILERLKDYDANITAEQASEHIKKLNEVRDKSISSATEECDKRVAEIIRMRDESKIISSEQAENMIADVKRQKEETINAAEETRNQAVEKITSMNSEISQSVDTTTGDMLSRWDRFKNWWSSWWPEPKTLTVNENKNSSVDHNWTGNSYFKGGFTTLHENGYELYDLPTGTKVYNHDSSEQMVLETAKQTAKGVIESMMKNNGANEGDIIIPISIAGEQIDRVVIPRVSNRMALESRKRR